MNDATHPRHRSARTRRLTRLVAVVAACATVAAVGSVVTAAASVANLFAERRARHQLAAEVHAALDSGRGVPLATMDGPWPITDDALDAVPTSAEVRLLRSDVDAALANLNEIAMQARIVPAVEGGRTIGFKVYSIRRGSLYERLGLENGDVVLRIDGMPLTSPDRALEAYARLRDARSVLLEVRRRGSPLRIDIHVDDD